MSNPESSGLLTKRESYNELDKNFMHITSLSTSPTREQEGMVVKENNDT
jgi:hypothetical protein